MNARLATAALAILSSLLTAAQDVAVDGKKLDPVSDALQELSTRDKAKPNEVTVVLEPVGEPPVAVPVEPPEPVVVTGKPPEKTDLAPEPPPPEVIATAPGEESPTPTEGLAVSVEKLHTGEGAIDPAQVKLFAPFPAKPLERPRGCL